MRRPIEVRSASDRATLRGASQAVWRKLWSMRLNPLGGLIVEGSVFHRTKPLLLLSYLALEGPTSRRELADLFFMNAKESRGSLSTAVR